MSTNSAYALGVCSMRTENPSRLISTSPSADFIINVGKNSDYPKWKMEFQCGAPNNKDVASVNGTDGIQRHLDNSGILGQPGCEFEGGTSHTIKVFAVTSTGQEVEQCIATYSVIDADTQCTLSVNPTSGITSATPLTVSGENLTSGGRFVFFFDDDAIDIPNNPAGKLLITNPGAANVDAPRFGPKSIPQDLMTPGNHTVSLRKRTIFGGPLSAITLQASSEKDLFDPPLCPVPFSVGSPSNPGSVLPPGTLPATPCTGANCTKAGGDPCKTPTASDNPGFNTAIGCIHTSPAAFVKDFLTFIIAISGGLAFLMMLLGAFQMLTSAGNPETLAAGKDRFTSAIIGLLFVIFAVLLMQIIGVGILGIPGFIK